MGQSPPAQSKTTLFHEYEGDGFYIAQFKTPELAIFSYYIQSQGQACLIDPTYDAYPYKLLMEKRDSKVTSVLLTHYHADYVAGHTEFDLPIVMGPKSSRQGSLLKVKEEHDSSIINLGLIQIKVLHTPGHTLQSTCFLLIDSKKKHSCLFTGDTIFLGQVGRPDLAVSSSVTKEDLAKMLFASLNKIKKEVDHSVRIYPTHGSGSSCGKNIGEGNFCTLEKQLQKNYALKIEKQVQFIEKILSQMPKPPSYFFFDATLNQTGKANRFDILMKDSLKPLTVELFKAEYDKGYTVIDSRQDFEGKSIKNSLMMSENGALASWVGAIVAPDTNLLLICNKGKEKDLIQRLFRIGYFNIKGYNSFDISEWQEKGYPIWEYRTVDANGMAEDKQKSNLDVRNLNEWKSTGVIQGSKLISLSQLTSKAEEVRESKNLYVNCKGGLRARLASSILAQKGIRSSIVADKFQNIEKVCKIVSFK